MSIPDKSPAEVEPVTHRSARRAAIASAMGSVLEWFDYIIYGTAAALIFNDLFFPNLSSTVGTLAAFLTFAVGFLARPIGAVIFGHMGDRHGRRVALVTTVTIMGASTALIGLLPSYSSIGIFAPLGLTVLRILQGVSLGGEWGGATSLTLEHSPSRHRARYNMLVQLGGPAGTVLASGVFALMSQLPSAAFTAWGWRIPFLSSLLLLAVAAYLRFRVAESPVFERTRIRSRVQRVPIVAVLRKSWRSIILGFLAVQLSVGGIYAVSTFAVNYGTEWLGMPRGLLLGATIIGAFAEMAMICIYGWLADKYGAIRIGIVGATLSIVAAFPTFVLIDTLQPYLVILGVIIGLAFVPSPFGVMGVILGGMFVDSTRYTGVSLTYNVGAIVGGLVPAICQQAVAAAGGNSWPASTVIVAISLSSLVGLIGASYLHATKNTAAVSG